MSRDDGILVLTTREKEWWLSLQEIIPAIDRVWTGIGRSRQEEVRTLCVPLTPELEQDLRDSASRLKRIVITSVTPGTVKVALFLRSELKVTAPMTLYMHGDGTDGLLTFGGLTELLTEADTFVVSCEAEEAAIRCCFPDAQVAVIPFPLVSQFKVGSAEWEAGPRPARLAYVGRISEQKNLHTLLLALWILRTRHGDRTELTLDVYGGEDGLGSPNMGLQFPEYAAYLRELAEALGVADMVTWHGPQPRDWVFYNVHLEPHVFVSPTLHSDENFGSSVLASLVNGHQVVTTKWGGHADFQEWFPQQLTLLPVRRSTLGPVLDPVLLADAIAAAVDRSTTTVVKDADLDPARAEFSESGATSRVLAMLGRPGKAPRPLQISETQRVVDAQRAEFGGKRKFYTGYEDPIGLLLFEAYGMKDPVVYDEQASYVLPPWVSCTDQTVRVVDPHRGDQTFGIDAEAGLTSQVTLCPSMETRRLPGDLVRTLVLQGYAFSLPPASATGSTGTSGT